VDLITTLWTLFRGGYTLQDLYPPAAGAGELSEDERTLLKHYRAAKPSVRGAIVQHAAFLAREGAAFGEDRDATRPDNVHELPRREASAEDALASEQLAHEAHAEVTAAQDTIRERKRGKGSRPRRMYGNGTNDKASG
jgi:hypothetical protein